MKCKDCESWTPKQVGIFGDCRCKKFAYSEDLQYQWVKGKGGKDHLNEQYYKRYTIATKAADVDIKDFPEFEGMFIYWDGSGYLANFMTHPHFGCIHFVQRHEPEQIEEGNI